ncbi:rod shape-determining protein MreC [bacterium]|nr:rod shape-determining protein MreC [bacterium]
MFFQKFWRQHKKRVFVALLFLLPFTPFVLKEANLPRIHFNDLVQSYVVHPVAEMLSSAKSGVSYLWDGYINLVDTQEQNVQLTTKVDELQAKLLELSELSLENERLNKLLSIPELSKSEGLGAKIIGKNTDNESLGFFINVGKDQGIRVGMPVLSARGAVGSIRNVFKDSSLFVSILDPSHAIDGVVRRTRARMIIEGLGASLLAQLKYLDRAEDVRVGDEVVASGVDGVFPKGVLIGNIVDLHRPRHGVLQEARLRAAVDIGKLEEVIVLLRDNPTREVSTPQ